MDKQQAALVRRYDFDDDEGQSLAVCLYKAAAFAANYEGGIMDMTLTRDTDGPVISIFTDDLPDTEGALIEQAGKTEELMFRIAQRLENYPALRDLALAERQRLITATLIAKEARP